MDKERKNEQHEDEDVYKEVRTNSMWMRMWMKRERTNSMWMRMWIRR